MWLDVQLGALIRQDATDNFKVIPERIADQIRRVEMAEFKIDTVHIFPAGSVYNSSDIGPDTSHAAHAARLKCAIESSSAQINVIPFPCSLANRDNLGVCCRIDGQLALIKPISYDFTVLHDYATDFTCARNGQGTARQLDRHTHELLIDCGIIHSSNALLTNSTCDALRIAHMPSKCGALNQSGIRAKFAAESEQD